MYKGFDGSDAKGRSLTFEMTYHVYETGDIETKAGILDGLWQIYEACIVG